MAIYAINNPGSSTLSFPSRIFNGDILRFNNTSTGRTGTIIEWAVPTTGTYRIKAVGARGGTGFGGFGASMEGDFELHENDLLKILVGQRAPGVRDGGGGYSGGGGGSYNSGENQNNISGIGTGHGLIEITAINLHYIEFDPISLINKKDKEVTARSKIFSSSKLPEAIEKRFYFVQANRIGGKLYVYLHY